MNNTLDAFNSRPDTAEEKLSKLEDTAIEIIQNEMNLWDKCLSLQATKW